MVGSMFLGALLGARWIVYIAEKHEYESYADMQFSSNAILVSSINLIVAQTQTNDAKGVYRFSCPGRLPELKRNAKLWPVHMELIEGTSYKLHWLKGKGHCTDTLRHGND